MSKSDIAVSVRGLSKAYTIAHEQEKHITLAETVLARLKNPLKRAKTETFWALKDIEFDINKGDVVGIIGRNGAGKSTLLKILSRITEPTTGKIELYGRVGSLLEVGTGFHPELTGRENVYLNGAILGMTKAEIKKQFDAIVDFSGVEKFLDTPVKRYSSGMYVRLAFAVAAHLNPEILIVDEVLAVGDAEFQKKCIGKMKDAATGGRTVLFVSHNMAAVELLCKECIFLARGSVAAHGSTEAVLSEYLAQQAISRNRPQTWPRPADSPVWIRRILITDEEGHEAAEFPFASTVSVHIHFRVSEPIQRLQIGLRLSTEAGVAVATFSDSDEHDSLAQHREAGDYELRLDLPPSTLLPNNYTFLVAAHSPGRSVYHQIEDAAAFSISSVGCERSLDGRHGVVLLRSVWTESSLQTRSDFQLASQI